MNKLSTTKTRSVVKSPTGSGKLLKLTPPLAKKRSLHTKILKKTASPPQFTSPLHTTAKRAISSKYIKKYSLAPAVHCTDHKLAFASKSTFELVRTNAIFALCRFKPLVTHANLIIRSTRRVLGDKFLESALRMTFYGHFCAGANELETEPILRRIAKTGIGSILDYGAEPEPDEMKVGTPNSSSTSTHDDSTAKKTAHQHSHDGVQCTHNHGDSNTTSNTHDVHTTVDDHIKAHEDLHNVFAFTTATPAESEIVIPGFVSGQIKNQPKRPQNVFGSLEMDSNPTKTEPKQTEAFIQQPPQRRYPIEHNKTYDSEIQAFKRSLDAVVHPKQHMAETIANPASKKKYTKSELLNLAKVVEEPTFIAVKITAIAPLKLLTRISTLINVHTYMWDIFQNRDKATLFYKKQKSAIRIVSEHDELHPSDDELLKNTPLHIDDMWDTMTRNDFVQRVIEFYDLTKEDGNELFDFYTTDSSKTIISRQDWCTNMNLHHMLSLGNKLQQNKIPHPPHNAPELLFHFPNLTPLAPRQLNSLIDREDIDELKRCMMRLDDVAKYSGKYNASIFVDAEQTYYQQAIDHMTMDLMATHNAPDENYQDLVKAYGKTAHPSKNKQSDAWTPGKIKIITTSVGDSGDKNGSSDEVELQFKPPKDLLEAKRLQIAHDIEYMENPTPPSLFKYISNPINDTPSNTTTTLTKIDDDEIDSAIASSLFNYKNTKHPVVWHTYQCYLKDSHYRIRRDFNLAQENGFTFATKIVRGAYLVGETQRAEELNYTNPLHSSIEETHDNYHKTMLFLLSQRNSNLENPAHFLIASHNQSTVEIATNYLSHELSVAKEQFKDEEQITLSQSEGNKGMVVKVLPKKHHLRTYFAQLYGMGLRLTYPIAANGFAGYNYITYGPVVQCLPYLLRRAQENGSLLGGTTTESKLIRKELVRRLLGRQ